MRPRSWWGKRPQILLTSTAQPLHLPQTPQRSISYLCSRHAVNGDVDDHAAHDFIQTLQDRNGRAGYDAHVGERGVKLSGGQRQRICIARALALNPKFIICDESVSALDVSVQAQVLNLLKSLQDEFGLTYIFISHDLSVVKFMSDRIMVMNQGRIEEIGAAEQIYRNPRRQYTQQLISAIPEGTPSRIQTLQTEREIAQIRATV